MRGRNENRAIAIVRVSSHRQRDNLSHEVQENEIAAYAAGEKLSIVRTARIVESAKDSDFRREYAEAVNWSLANDVGHLLFYMYDRESRNLTDNEKNEKLVRAGLISIHYVRDRKRIDSKSPDSDFFMRDIHAVTNKHFVRNLRAKVLDAFRQKAESGWFPHNHVWLGYVHQRVRDDAGRELKRGTIIVPDPVKKNVDQVVREFDLRAQGRSYDDIRRQIILDGFIPAEKVKAYHKSGIERRISSKFYRGYFDYAGVEYKGKHELIIPENLLRTVDETIGFRGRGAPSHGVFGGGWLTCHSCGCFVVLDVKTKKLKRSGEMRSYRYYHCTNGKRQHENLKGMSATEESLWEQFGEALDDFTISETDAADISAYLNKAHEKVRHQRRKEISDYRLALQALEQSEDEAYRDMKAGLLDEPSYRRQVDRIRSERMNYTHLLEEENAALDGAYLETAKSILELASSAKSLWFTRTAVERRDFLERVLSNRALDGVIVRYELKKPFAALSLMKANGEWRPHADDFRTAILSLAA